MARCVETLSVALTVKKQHVTRHGISFVGGNEIRVSKQHI